MKVVAKDLKETTGILHAIARGHIENVGECYLCTLDGKPTMIYSMLTGRALEFATEQAQKQFDKRTDQ